MRFNRKPNWWGGPRHRLFTLVVFVMLASLDNAARGVFPPLYAVIARSFSVTETALGVITALNILVVALTAVLWGYWGDRSRRKPLLFYGTLIWSVAMFLTGLAQTYLQLLLFQLITAIGIGCISSVGFSVVTDFVPARRRGLAMSFWGLSQGGGGGAGALLGGLLGAYNWPLPFLVIAGAGFLFATLYLLTFEPQRGRTEPELTRLFTTGQGYQHHIQWTDIRHILTKPSNIWLIAQAFAATLVYGSLVWMPRLFIARVEAAGYPLETATVAGNLFSLLFQTGFYFAIPAGYLGDRWQRRNPRRGRAWLSMIGVLATIPFQVAVFFMPLSGLSLPAQGDVMMVVSAVLLSIVTNPWVAGTFGLALIAVALASVDTPNRNALIIEVNLPEHRGTVAGMVTIAIGVGLALGNGLVGLLFTTLAPHFAPPLNYALGLAWFHLFFIPAGFFFYQAGKTIPQDIIAARRVLRERAELTIPHR